jgi:hypothetical protein
MKRTQEPDYQVWFAHPPRQEQHGRYEKLRLDQLKAKMY